MSPYLLGIFVAQHRNVANHLKQAYAQGFAEVLEKRAELSPEEKKRILDLVRKYSRKRKKHTIRTLLGLAEPETEMVPGVDIMGNRMNEDYFKPDWKARGLQMRTKGPDPMNRFPGVENWPMGTIGA